MQGLTDPRDLNSNIHWQHLINTVLPVSLTNPRVDRDVIWKQSVGLPAHSSLPVQSPPIKSAIMPISRWL